MYKVLLLITCLLVGSGPGIHASASPAMEVTAKVIDLMKDGKIVVDNEQSVNAIPKGTSFDAYNWKGPATYSEGWEATKTLLGFTTADFKFEISWLYDGTYIGNFRADVSGTADAFAQVDIKVRTDQAHLNSDGIVELPYRIIAYKKFLANPTELVTYTGVAYGNGGGRSGR